MIIRLTRGKNDKPPVLTCIRDDGSVTYQAGSEFFARHDLLHYAVETTLGYSDAFFGLVARGRNIDDFGTRNGMKDTYPLNAQLTEQIVIIVQFSFADAVVPNDAELAERIATSSIKEGLPVPTLTPEQVGQIRRAARDLHAGWERLAPGASLELPFAL